LNQSKAAGREIPVRRFCLKENQQVQAFAGFKVRFLAQELP